ncbi:HEAT repeat-containing protein 6 isoform X3 [Thalassophryne amazonica]|uniref:HEAT repeat-containing protein 6 isoform X3 n=1 Tax=Thalassophryne amazonica TaxID=390379 RepID=UPI0014709B40|nr:HEAT repeat-containing protein 6 isoform X3 [Thalassophryne amazonica]
MTGTEVYFSKSSCKHCSHPNLLILTSSSTVIQAALKGLQSCVFFGKWTFGGEEELGSVLAVLKKLMFHGGPAGSVDWPAVLYPAPLPQYEGLAPSKPPEPAKPPEAQTEATVPGNISGKNKKRKSRGKGKKTGRVEDGAEDEKEVVPVLQKGGVRGGREEFRNGESLSKPSVTSFYPSWKQSSSDSEISDQENTAQNKLRYYHGRVRQGALQCLLTVLKSIEKQTMYGYWSSFIPEPPIGGPPALTLLTVILKDPSAKVRACAIQVVSAMLEGSRQFLAVAEDMSTPRASFTSLSFSLATSIRELHRTLGLALLAEASAHTLTQVIKCLAYLLGNSPYHRLKPGLLSTLFKQLSPYVRHKDANVRVSVLTLYGALLKNQAPLPEVEQLLQQPEGISSNGGACSFTQQNSVLPWRQRGAVSLSSPTPVVPSQQQVPDRPGEGDTAPLWLMQLCMLLVTETREDQSNSDGGEMGRVVLEPAPVRVEALQVLSNLLCGYYSLVQPHLTEIVQLSTHCLVDADRSVQLHSSKLLEEFGTGIIQQYKANNVPESSRVPIDKVVQLWSEVLSGPLNGALQNENHPKLQSSACDVLSHILPEAFAQLPDKTQLMCITVLLGLFYSENYMVRSAAVRALGFYVQFPCLREDVMFLADTANTILTAFDDRSPVVWASAHWSLGHLTDTLVINMEKMGMDFQEEISDMLLLKMLQAATRASAVHDRVICYTVRALGNLLYFLRESQMTRSVFQCPVEEAVRTLVESLHSETIMKVRWNACYALGTAFKNPVLLQDGQASWICDAFAALCHGVTSHAVFKVRIGSAAALAKPVHRDCYGDTTRFSCVWHSLATGLEKSKETNDFYSAGLRHTLSHAVLHLLSLSELQDMPALGASLLGEDRSRIEDHLIRYLRDEEVAEKPKDCRDDTSNSQQRIQVLRQTLIRLKGLKGHSVDQGAEENGREVVVEFLEDLLKSCEESC